jgi:hypothetical protein
MEAGRGVTLARQCESRGSIGPNGRDIQLSVCYTWEEIQWPKDHMSSTHARDTRVRLPVRLGAARTIRELAMEPRWQRRRGDRSVR